MQEGKKPKNVTRRLRDELGFAFVKDSEPELGKGKRKDQVVNAKSEIWKKEDGDKVHYVRIDELGHDVDPKWAGAKEPHYHVDTCDKTKPAADPVRDANGRPQKNPDGTWQSTPKEDPNGTVKDPATGKTYQSQDQHFEKEWEPGAVNNDKDGNPVHPGDKDWADKTHLHDPSW